MTNSSAARKPGMRTARTGALALGVVLLLFSWDRPAFPAQERKLTLSGGTVIEYALVLPGQFDTTRAYPALLVFPGGKQTMGTVRGALERYWETEGARRGFIVISPAAPNGISFTDGSETLVPEFLRHFLSEFRIEERKFHLGGNSNGGKSAFRVAILYPDFFRSLTVLAGFPPEERDLRQLLRIKGLRVNMFVGESDPAWLGPMLASKARFDALGIDVFFQSLRGNGHFLPDLSFGNSGRIFDRIERTRSNAP